MWPNSASARRPDRGNRPTGPWRFCGCAWLRTREPGRGVHGASADVRGSEHGNQAEGSMALLRMPRTRETGETGQTGPWRFCGCAWLRTREPGRGVHGASADAQNTGDGADGSMALLRMRVAQNTGTRPTGPWSFCGCAWLRTREPGRGVHGASADARGSEHGNRAEGSMALLRMCVAQNTGNGQTGPWRFCGYAWLRTREPGRGVHGASADAQNTGDGADGSMALLRMRTAQNTGDGADGSMALLSLSSALCHLSSWQSHWKLC
ncbi:uncharacterized protein LOC122696302 [Cervus elaphus]|uniref:uncharacterized protein LOC122696302 n=1 Tax=Cervus elaphus TaxID=9860 RepID=UPI001CC3102A|nr:uncharacterized protein LOC122696302 [Cervus elaphus]